MQRRDAEFLKFMEICLLHNIIPEKRTEDITPPYSENVTALP